MHYIGVASDQARHLEGVLIPRTAVWLTMAGLVLSGSLLFQQTSSLASSSLAFSPSADSHVSQRSPNANYGGDQRLIVMPGVNSYMRFDISGVQGAVTSATLLLYNEKGASSGYEIRSVADNSWQEHRITFNNAPPAGDRLDWSGVARSGQWTALNVTSIIQGNGTYSFALIATGRDEGRVTSREGNRNRWPVLLLEVGSSTSPSPGAPATSTPAPTSTPVQEQTMPGNGNGLIPADIGINFGVYDFARTFGENPSMAIQHEFVSWVADSYQTGLMKAVLDQSRSRARVPMVTVEPFARAGLNANNLLQDIVAGRYDSNIRWVCESFRDYRGTIYVRWGHEMEHGIGRYPWATTNGGAFINAYRYFVDQCRAIVGHASTLHFVWSPAGNRELTNYWPGANYVDFVGLSVYNLPEWERDFYGRVRSFEENFGEKYARVSNYGKPVIIAEFGVSGSEEFKKQWLSAGLQAVSKFPLLKSLVIFNAVDPVAWGPNYPAPDWRLNPEWFAPTH